MIGLKFRLLDLLVCPYCRQPLECQDLQLYKEDFEVDPIKIPCRHRCGFRNVDLEANGPPSLSDCKVCIGSEIEEGTLRCDSCGRTFPIVRGIPRILPDELREDVPAEYSPDFVGKRESLLKCPSQKRNDTLTIDLKKRTIRSFSYEWKTFSSMYEEYLDQFLDWIFPLEPVFFDNKLVLDAGCGLGRHVYHAAKFGAEVVGMDISEAVEVAYEHTRHLSNVHTVQADIYYPPFREGFDFIYSIGVLHHLPDPERGFKTILNLLRPKGSVFVWVYGRENNFFMTKIVDPIRKITSRLPVRILDILCIPTTFLLHITTKIYKMLDSCEPTRILARHLPYNPYFLQISDFCFKHKHSIVFDFLSVPICNFYTRNQFETWFEEADLKNIQISWRNRNSWRGFGTK